MKGYRDDQVSFPSCGRRTYFQQRLIRRFFALCGMSQAEKYAPIPAGWLRRSSEAGTSAGANRPPQRRRGCNAHPAFSHADVLFRSEAALNAGSPPFVPRAAPPAAIRLAPEMRRAGRGDKCVAVALPGRFLLLPSAPADAGRGAQPPEAYSRGPRLPPCPLEALWLPATVVSISTASPHDILLARPPAAAAPALRACPCFFFYSAVCLRSRQPACALLAHAAARCARCTV